jgi:hypothetical protein
MRSCASESIVGDFVGEAGLDRERNCSGAVRVTFRCELARIRVTIAAVLGLSARAIHVGTWQNALCALVDTAREEHRKHA